MPSVKRQWLTPKEVSEQTGISTYMVRKMCRTNQIKARKFGNQNWYIPASEVYS